MYQIKKYRIKWNSQKHLNSSSVRDHGDGLKAAGVFPTRFNPAVHEPLGVFTAIHGQNVLAGSHKAVHGTVKCGHVRIAEHVANFTICVLHLQHVHIDNLRCVVGYTSTL